jgi:hypothetical protein
MSLVLSKPWSYRPHTYITSCACNCQQMPFDCKLQQLCTFMLGTSASGPHKFRVQFNDTFPDACTHTWKTLEGKLQLQSVQKVAEKSRGWLRIVYYDGRARKLLSFYIRLFHICNMPVLSLSSQWSSCYKPYTFYHSTTVLENILQLWTDNLRCLEYCIIKHAETCSFIYLFI